MKILALLIAMNSYGAVLKHETVALKYQEFSYKEVCELLGAKNLELIEAKSVSEIDCMGKSFQAIDFCLKKMPESNTLTRAIMDDSKKMLKCESSSNVTVSLTCDQRDARFCLDAKKGCEDLKKIYAMKLDLIHFSMLDKTLNCYYSKPLGDFDETN